VTPAAPAVPRGTVLLLGAAAAVIIVAGMRAAAWLIAPALLALVIVIVVSPVHSWLRRHGFRGWMATTVLVVAVYGVLIAFAVTVIVSLVKLTALLPTYSDRLKEVGERATGLAANFGVDPGQLRAAVSSLDLGKVLSGLLALLGSLTGIVSSVVFLLALLMFFSFEATGIDTRLTEIAEDRPEAHVVLRDFARKTRRYLIVTTVFGLIVAVLDAVALAVMGIPLFVLWALLSFVTNYIQNIGFILGVLPPALLALLGSGWQLALAVVAVYVVVNFVVQSLIQPRYVGDAVGLSTALTFVALVFWAWVLGPLGVVLAIPATLLIMAVLVDIDPRAGWVTALLRAPARSRHGRSSPVDDAAPTGSTCDGSTANTTEKEGRGSWLR
jgi:AI-2 transport protein TqsA